MLKKIVPYFSKYKYFPFLAFLSILVEVVCEVGQPIIMLKIIDEGIPNRDTSMILWYGILMIIVAMISLGAGVLGAKFASIAGTGVASELRSAQMKKIQEFSFKNLDFFSNASLITRMTSDVTNVQNTAIMTMRILARAPMMFLFAFFFAVSLNAQLSLVFVVAVPFLVVSLALIISTAFPRFRLLQQATDGINRILQENFIGIRVVKSFVREPFERVQIDTPEEYMGSIIESLSNRKGEMQDMQHSENGQVRIVFLVPARGLLGYTTEFLSMTRGYGIMNHTFDQYLPYIAANIGGRRNGALVSTDTGKSTTYGIMGVEDRGVIFTEPGTEIYEGMIVGEHSRENDLAVNITKAKQQTNIRSATKDQTSVIKTPKKLSLEESLEFLSDDEYCEITPETIRLRKQILNKGEREKANKRKKQAEAENN